MTLSVTSTVEKAMLHKPLNSWYGIPLDGQTALSFSWLLGDKAAGTWC